MEYKVICEKLDHFGRGMSKIDGKIIFVDGLLSTEEAFIKIVKDNKKYLEGKIVKLLSQSKDRIKPICPYINCGCSLKHLKYEKQLEFKEEKVKNIISKYTGKNIKINKIIKSDKTWNYRNKVTLKVDQKLGYYENKTNKLIPIKGCKLASDKINEVIKILNTLNLSNTKEIVIKDFDQIMIDIKGDLDITPLKDIADSIFIDDKLVYGKETINTNIDDLSFIISKNSFFQVNSLMGKLYNIAVNYCKEANHKKVIDLYCGTGTLTLLLSKYCKEVIGVEISKEMINIANLNKENNKIKNVTFICNDAANLNNLTADIITVDPPRSGLSKTAIKNILNINPSKIIYISCNPMTLARDLNSFKDQYDIKEITPIDMFPNTYHVETVTLLEKSEPILYKK